MSHARYIVTGGAGFIGSHLAERLLKEGAEVVVIDDFSTGNAQNLASFRDHPHLRVIESKVSECAALGDLVAGAEGVFHLAAAHSDDPIESGRDRSGFGGGQFGGRSGSTGFDVRSLWQEQQAGLR
jgi:nucleoside-diphosphate-sugar epimerase